jgi:hypothetical protein
LPRRRRAARRRSSRCISAEVPHRVLEAARRALVVDAEHLAVEHEVTTRQSCHQGRDSAETIGDVVEVARVQPYRTVAPVGLDTSAVELPLD